MSRFWDTMAQMAAMGTIDPSKTQWIDEYNQITNDRVAGTIKARYGQNNQCYVGIPTRRKPQPNDRQS
ncbi:MAG: hypothetical protein LIP02_00160 [Bacteroidales bacterium]|nr:hypothetical protein [Bacteroidales bacterium]